MTPLLSVSGLTKRYGPRIGCADISFDLYPGEVMGIVGEIRLREIYSPFLPCRAYGTGSGRGSL